MAEEKQLEELHQQAWQVANEVRGSANGWDVKQYVLGVLFYRFISEACTHYIESLDDSINYADQEDAEVAPETKEKCVGAKGYFLYPSQLFANVVSNAATNNELHSQLTSTFREIEASASGHPSEGNIKGIFSEFDTNSSRLGNTVEAKNNRLVAILKGIAGLKFDDLLLGHSELFCSTFEFLVLKYATYGGPNGDELFTPHHVSSLISRLAMHKQQSVNKVYDPTCGSSSLMLQTKRYLDEGIITEGYFGQDVSETAYNLSRMNMFLHEITCDKFNIKLGNTLTEPHFQNEELFDVVVSNPPFSTRWVGSDCPKMLTDKRFVQAGVLPPTSKADFAFLLHSLSYLSDKGRAVLVCYPGMLFRGGAEQRIRKYLIDNNYVETVISLPPNIFYHTSIATTVVVLSKNKNKTGTQFIDASGEDFFENMGDRNVMLDQHIDHIIKLYDKKVDVEHVAVVVGQSAIVENNYNLMFSNYIEAKGRRIEIDIAELNSRLKELSKRNESLRGKVSALVRDIENR